jgi:hypothetical protein
MNLSRINNAMITLSVRKIRARTAIQHEHIDPRFNGVSIGVDAILIERQHQVDQ